MKLQSNVSKPRLSLSNASRNTVPSLLLLAIIACQQPLRAAPTIPVYGSTTNDYVTGTNTFQEGGKTHWFVSPGADAYFQDVYERPTAQSYDQYAGGYATKDVEYFGNLDITRGLAGYDSQYAYFGIELFSTYKVTADLNQTFEGMVYDYRIRLSTSANGSAGFLLTSDQPLLKNGTTFGSQSTFIYRDVNGDVAVDGNGYETVLASDGKLSGGQTVLYSRVNPTNATLVEFALDYAALGLSVTDLNNLPYLVFEANKGLKDPANYLWNQEYTSSEAGSPNDGPGNLSEFGTQGLGNIYELDTLRGSLVPEPSSALLLGVVGFLALVRRRLA